MSLRFSFSRLIALLAVLLAPTFSAAAPVAEIAETKGAVSVIKKAGKQLLVSPQSTVEEGDLVVTETNSTAVLAFTDGGKVVLRPNTRFVVTRYHYAATEPAQDKGVFGLLAGGLRTLTGAIGKRADRDAYQMKGATATIGIRGTEYTARLCKGDCGEVITQKSALAGRLASLQGNVTATDTAGRRRILTAGASLAAGDTVDTDAASWAALVFNDDSRIVLRANSSLRIQDYHHEPATPAAGNFVMKLFKGALRAATGRIARQNPAVVKFESATATIGIRGTDFSSACVDSGSLGQGQPVSMHTTNCGQGQIAEVHTGRIAMTTQVGSIEIGPGETAYADSPQAVPGVVSTPFRLPGNDGAPEPEALPSFDSLPAVNAGEGLYVLVHEGRIALTQGGQTLELGSGESAFAGMDGTTLERLDATPDFLGRDPFLRTVNFDSVSCSLP